MATNSIKTTKCFIFMYQTNKQGNKANEVIGIAYTSSILHEVTGTAYKHTLQAHHSGTGCAAQHSMQEQHTGKKYRHSRKDEH